MFKNLNGLTQLLKNASSMGERVKEMRAELAVQVVQGTAEDGKIHVQITGVGEVQSVTIAPELMSEEASRIEELLPIALNEALSQVRQLHVDKMREATGGIDLPGLDDALANL